jgi:hypothetical protein
VNNFFEKSICKPENNFALWLSNCRIYDELGREAQDRPWKLKQAWKTDQEGNLIEEYPVP